MKRLVLAAPFLATMTCLAGEIETVDSSPVAEGGDYVRRITIDEHHWSYIHVFTNASAVQTFKSTVGWPLKVRYLVVGGGGRGGNGTTNKAGSGGGGGGGVAEKDNVLFAAGASWSVCVGKGAVELSTQAESSSISNGVSEICAVPGGGSGAYGNGSVDAPYVEPIAGAAGGGGGYGATSSPGAIGTFGSCVLGMTPPTDGYAGGNSKNFAGGGGGGAGEAGGNGTSVDGLFYGGKGGEGLTSDITGEGFVYGSGGGGGSINGTYNQGPGGAGGTNAGSGAGRDLGTGNTLAATAPVPNSGAGGGGGCGSGKMLIGTAGADGIVVIRYDLDDHPCVGGDFVTRIPRSETRTTYIHVFTNVLTAASFYNRSGKDLKMRYLVVGGGGAGGRGYANYGGGGGGGGGVAEVSRVVLPSDTEWMVRVGAGSVGELPQAGGSSISNGVTEVCAVPGGGNGAFSSTDGSYSYPTTGAAGGGGAESPTTGDKVRIPGASGNFASYVLGMARPEDGYSGGRSFSFWGGGGGGAGEAGKTQTDKDGERYAGDGGEGLTSDITGTPFVYGSGGGGGAVNGKSNYGPGGLGGTNAGNGGGVVGKSATESGTDIQATAPVANSGAGGGGGLGTNAKPGTMGADGIVVIRYDYSPVDPGLMLIFR